MFSAYLGRAKEVFTLLRDIESPRVVRCVLFLANGDFAELAKMREAARRDYRDVIWWAEYDHPSNPEKRLRDFDQPFSTAALD